MTDILLTIASESWLVLGQMAPYLLFGFLVAGVLSVCISPEFVERHLGGRGFRPVVKAALLGVPLPLCSCGVIPVAASLRRHGASRAATTSFLLSTPQTGVDSILVTYALLGPVFAVFRPLVELVTGLLGGLLVMLFAEKDGNDAGNGVKALHCTAGCCADTGRKNIIRRAMEYGFVVLPRDIGPALVVGVIIAGCIAALVPPNQWQPYLGGGIGSIAFMMLLGVPLYVCASASVPIAVGLIHAGASPGAALAFLIAGPATNAATITTIWRVLGRRTAVLYLLTIVISAVCGGLVLDWLSPDLPAVIAHPEHVHEALPGSWIPTAWAVLLLGVLALSYTMKPSPEVEHALEPHNAISGAQPSERLELAIEGMTCGHCSAAVSRALAECPGVVAVEVDLAAGRAIISGEQLDSGQLTNAVASLGYRAHI